MDFLYYSHSCLNICHHYLCGTKNKCQRVIHGDDPKRWRSASGDKLSYRFQNPKRFDIIVFPYQYEENTYYIKRIIGLPGETVQVVDGYVYINGSRLESDIYGNELMDDPMAASQPITLGEDEYFVLGDNRNHSQDSRDPSVGEVKKDTIMGKAWVRIYPFDKMGVIRHE